MPEPVKDYKREPFIFEGVAVWQACYVCGRSITFAKDSGKWISIGKGIIRHKKCTPPPAR